MKNVLIMGYSGSGKSVIGRNAAEQLNYQFAETSGKMQEVTGLLPETLLKKYGSIRYCSEEELIFQKLARKENMVITVDSLLCDRERLLILKPGSFFVLLRVETELLYRRLQKRSGKKLPFAELEADIKRYEDMCMPLCDFTLPAAEFSIENAAAAIVQEFRKRC